MKSGTTGQIERCFASGERAQHSILQGVQGLLVVGVGLVHSAPARAVARAAQSSLESTGFGLHRASAPLRHAATASSAASARTVPVCRDGRPVHDDRAAPEPPPPPGSDSPIRSYSQCGSIPDHPLQVSVLPIGGAAKAKQPGPAGPRRCFRTSLTVATAAPLRVLQRSAAHAANLAQDLSEFSPAGAAPMRARKSAPVSHCTSQSPMSARRSASVIGANSSARSSAVATPWTTRPLVPPTSYSRPPTSVSAATPPRSAPAAARSAASSPRTPAAPAGPGSYAASISATRATSRGDRLCSNPITVLFRLRLGKSSACTRRSATSWRC